MCSWSLMQQMISLNEVHATEMLAVIDAPSDVLESFLVKDAAAHGFFTWGTGTCTHKMMFSVKRPEFLQAQAIKEKEWRNTICFHKISSSSLVKTPSSEN